MSKYRTVIAYKEYFEYFLNAQTRKVQAKMMLSGYSASLMPENL